MGWFWNNNETNEEEDGELETMSREYKQNLAELECEEAIMKDKEDFGRVRNSMMKVLRAKYGRDVADRVLSRINKRIQQGYFESKSIF